MGDLAYLNPIAGRSSVTITAGNLGSYSRSDDWKPGLASTNDVTNFTARRCCRRELRHQKPTIFVETLLVVVVSYKRESIVVVSLKRAWIDLQQRFLLMYSRFREADGLAISLAAW
ncbi:hypothetical protein TIFTF001_014036 [Ficus carica]|uniref:Uncharacterized protein n=1 Tax=Ficus carica TaxID=3494 RepID=A0AA87ZYS7_FICCA|nr:hypothetical protein TIFTF001_014036 [Ficus carica]